MSLGGRVAFFLRPLLGLAASLIDDSLGEPICDSSSGHLLVFSQPDRFLDGVFFDRVEPRGKFQGDDPTGHHLKEVNLMMEAT